MKITVIGSGNIGSALVNGLLADGKTAAADITMTDIRREALDAFVARGVRAETNNAAAVEQADMVVLCVKPYLVEAVVGEFAPFLGEKTIFVSFAAGVSLDRLTQMLGERPLFRVIPNTAMAVCQSMTAIAHQRASETQIQKVFDFFGTVGKAIMIDESLMNAATVLGSCGTAFALRFLRAASLAGIEIGLKPDVATAMVAQTMLGAAILAGQGNHPEQEIDKVSTPKGITIKGLNEMEHAGLSSAVMRGVLAAYRVMG